MKNNDLVPTRIVNRNGVTTTVYRKHGTSNAAALIPKPSAPSKAPANRSSWINDRLTKHPHVSEEMMLASSHSYFDGELGNLAYKLLSSGTSTGQQLVSESLSSYVGDHAAYISKGGKYNASKPPYVGNLIHGEIIRKWNYGNICHEAGISPESITRDRIVDLKYTHSMITSGVSFYDEVPEEAHYTMSPELETYWRGASILALAFDFEDSSDEAGEEWQNFDKFIPWAANHTDIKAVISAVKHHTVLDPEKLEQLMEAEASGVPVSMTTGWL